MKYLIVGLGNIGEEYENTRHNIGFIILDDLVKSSNIIFTANKLASTCEYKFKGRSIILIKPSTYMNLSGKAVNYWMRAEKIPLENVLIITDDIALPLGSLRLKTKGRDGGHNGLKSISETLGTEEFARLRVGVGNDFSKGKQVDYVLGKWSAEETALLAPRIALSIDIIKAFTTIGLQRTMNTYNNK